MLAIQIAKVELSYEQDTKCSRHTKAGRDVVARDNVRLQVGQEGEDGDPGGEDVGERIHHGRDVGSLLGVVPVHFVDEGPA